MIGKDMILRLHMFASFTSPLDNYNVNWKVELQGFELGGLESGH